MENTLVQENKLIQLENIEAEMLPELQGWREKQLEIVKENPFISIEDTKTYEEAKRSRTALVSARTSIEKQDRLIASKLKDFRNKVSQASKELIAITQPHEEAQQEEVKIYEAKKEEERIEKERLQQERKDNIQKGLSDFFKNWKEEISNLEFLDIDNTKSVMKLRIDEYAKNDIIGFESDYERMAESLYSLLSEKINSLQEKEKTRIERERLEAERKAFELQQKEAREKAEKEEAERKAKIEAEEAERKAKLQKEEDVRKAIEAKERATREAEENKIREQQKAEADRLAKERAELEAEKQRIAEEKAKEQAEIEAKRQAEIKAKEDAEIKKRHEALKPDIEKLINIIGAIELPSALPTLKDAKAISYLEHTRTELTKLKNGLMSGISKALK